VNSVIPQAARISSTYAAERRRQPPDERSELIEEALQEFPRALVADIPVRVDDMDL